MELGISPEWKRQIDDVVVQLRDPFKLRITSVAVVCILGFGTIYHPLDRDLTALRAELTAARTRESLVEHVEKLRAGRARILKLFPEKGDINFWSEYFLDGTRKTGVQLRSLESKIRPQKAGKLQGVYLDLEVDGSYKELHDFVAWVEQSQWFTRIIHLKMKNKDGKIEARITAAVMADQEQRNGR
jgi:hypothetical protein